MENLASLTVTFLEKDSDENYEFNEYIVGEEDVESIKVSKMASGIEAEITVEGITTTYGWPWCSIKSYEYAK